MIDKEIAAETKLFLMKMEMEQLLEEYARSMGVNVTFTFNSSNFGSKLSNGNSSLFTIEVEVELIEEGVEGKLFEKDSLLKQYESNWNNCSRHGLQQKMLGHVVEVPVQGRSPMKYKILGLTTTSSRKRNCVAILDIESGNTYVCSAQFILSGTMI
jgi:hypothetical protein